MNNINGQIESLLSEGIDGNSDHIQGFQSQHSANLTESPDYRIDPINYQNK